MKKEFEDIEEWGLSFSKWSDRDIHEAVESHLEEYSTGARKILQQVTSNQ